MESKIINGTVYRKKDNIIGMVDSVSTNWICLNIWMPYKQWLLVREQDAFHSFCEIVKTIYPDAEIKWHTLYPAKKSEEQLGDLLVADKSVAIIYPHGNLPDEVYAAFGMQERY